MGDRTKSGMLSLLIIKHLDVLEARCFHVVMRGVADSKHSFVFETVEPDLHRRVVPAIPFPPHRASHAALLKLLLKRMAGIIGCPGRSGASSPVRGVCGTRPWSTHLSRYP